MTLEVSRPTWMSLYLESYFNDEILSSATAFVVEHSGIHYLITNRHNVTGRDNFSNKVLSKKGAIPNLIRIYLRTNSEWKPYTVPLYDNNDPQANHLWYEHPTHGGKVDVVAIRLPDFPSVQYSPYSLIAEETPQVFPSDNLSVVGFPFGKRSFGYLAIWTTGFLATDMTIDYENLPLFLIDCRTRAGQSGSPVIAQRNGGFGISASGLPQIHTGSVTRLLGIYSSRINKRSDLGYVWKLVAIREIIESIE